jgi:hypothetical protein
MANKFVDDELDELPTTKTTAPVTTDATTAVTEEVEAPAPKATKASAAVDEDEENLDVDFGDQKIMAKGDGLNRIRADKNKVVRFALLPFIKPKSATSHFVEAKEKKGTFRCLKPTKEGEIPFCCAKLKEEGMLHVVSLAVLYTNAEDKTGKYSKDKNGNYPPVEWEVGYVDLSRSNYRSVSNLAPEDSTPYDIDLVMSKKDNGIGYEFVLAATKAKWKLNPDMAVEIEAAAQKFINDGGKKLISKLGRTLNKIEWQALLSNQAASGKEASLDDIEGIE